MISIVEGTINVFPVGQSPHYIVSFRFAGGRIFKRPMGTNKKEAEEMACRTALSHPSFTDILNDGDWLSV